MLADARPAAAQLAHASLAVVLADARAAAFLAPASLAVVRAFLPHRASSCPRSKASAPSLPMLLLPCQAACLVHGNRSLLHNLLFSFSVKATLLVLVSRCFVVRRRVLALTARPLCCRLRPPVWHASSILCMMALILRSSRGRLRASPSILSLFLLISSSLCALRFSPTTGASPSPTMPSS